MQKNKTIFHIDVDSFFVNAIITLKPELKGKEVAVSINRNSAIATSLSYEAKLKGAKVGMPLFKIKKYCPNIIIEEPRYELFSFLSNQIFNFLATNFTKKIEIASIDECYLDVSDILFKYKSSYELAKQIQALLNNELKIPVSIGISYNKFLAKMASPIAKPFGIKIFNKNNFREIYNFKISQFYGIGKSSIAKLNDNNIYFIKDLLNKNKENFFLKIFKNRWYEIKNNLVGKGIDLLNYEHNDVKTMGKERTFVGKFVDDRNELLSVIKHLSDIVSHNAKKRFILGYVVAIILKYQDKSKISAQRALNFPINEACDIYENALELLDQAWNEQPLKLIGIRLGQLVNFFESNIQIPLFNFNDKKNIENTKVENIISELNANFKAKTLFKASNFPNKEKSQNIQSRFSENDRHKK